MADTVTTPAVPLFQKAHSRMMTLHRVDEQLSALLQQRTTIQQELRSIQQQINHEFERVTMMDEEAPAKILSQISEIAKGNATASGTPTAPETHEEPLRPQAKVAKRIGGEVKAANGQTV
jgi:ABC-type Fe3+/spermidine/putrescine transport system ATPase subunit